jgi:hypothetical protein
VRAHESRSHHPSYGDTEARQPVPVRLHHQSELAPPGAPMTRRKRPSPPKPAGPSANNLHILLVLLTAFIVHDRGSLRNRHLHVDFDYRFRVRIVPLACIQRVDARHLGLAERKTR